MRLCVFLALLSLVTATAPCQEPAQVPSPTVNQAKPAITVTSNLVVVPTQVKGPAGELIPNLQASDFKLLDNQVRQNISAEQDTLEPISLVVVMQTGGAAIEQFPNYRGLPAMVEYLIGAAKHRVGLVTFDSQPEYEWDFTSNLADLKDDLAKPEPGNDGAAVLDAVAHGIDMLKTQPAGSQRVLLLLSQQHDSGSHVHVEEIVRSLGENNILVYSVMFSPQKQWLKDQFTKPRHAQPLYQMSPALPMVDHTFDLKAPLTQLIRAMQTNTASEVANLTGGTSFEFLSQKDLEAQLIAVGTSIASRYRLTFQPTSKAHGYHRLDVSLPDHPGYNVSARPSYWSQDEPQHR